MNDGLMNFFGFFVGMKGLRSSFWRLFFMRME